MDNKVFFQTVIEGREFIGWMSGDGPIITTRTGGWVQLGVCSIARCSERRFAPETGERKWSIAKYDNQPRVDVHSLSDAGREELSRQFGIPMATRAFAHEHTFLTSPAFEGLVAWAKRHPRLYKQYSDCVTYIRDWPARVGERIQAAPYVEDRTG